MTVLPRQVGVGVLVDEVEVLPQFVDGKKEVAQVVS